MEKLKLQVKQKRKAVKLTGNEFVEWVRLLEKKNYMSFIIKGNGQERKSNRRKEDIASLKEAVVKIV